MRIKSIMPVAAALILAGCGGNQENQDNQAGSGPIEEAPAVPLVNASGERIGEVRGGDSTEGAVLQIVAQGLPPGTHGMHIHDVGICEGPSFESAGPHWNPENKQHGLHNPQGPHRGDLPNIRVGSDGNFQGTVIVEASNLRGSRLYGFANQIIDDNGAALVIHSGADDYQTDPSGNSGDRIACAALGEPGGATQGS